MSSRLILPKKEAAPDACRIGNSQAASFKWQVNEPAESRQARQSADLRELYRRITLHIVPFPILLYVIAYLNRVNVGFAAVTMNRDLGLRSSAFGLAAGIFFVGYLLFSVPSNLMLVRVGAPKWIAVIMILWGLLSCTEAFVSGPTGLVIVRFLIGAAEAGFYPGIILYLTHWLPSSERAGLMGLFNLSVPLSIVMGGPISTQILTMTGHGLHGWQWLFLVEGLPAVILGCIVPLLLIGRPDDATWLTMQERMILSVTMNEDAESSTQKDSSPKRFLLSIIGPGLVYLSLMIGLYVLSFWTPAILNGVGISIHWLGWLIVIPFAAGGLAMFLWSKHADRTGHHRLYLILAFFIAALGFSIAGLTRATWAAIGFLSVASIGVLAGLPLFWAYMSDRLGQRKAIAIASINSLGNIGGFVGPYAIGRFVDASHGYRTGLVASAICLFAGGVLACSCLPGRIRS